MSYLINTLETPGEFDALSTLRPGEPYFLLVGRDRLAPRAVLEWVDRNRRRAMDESRAGGMSEEELDRELRKSTQAETIAWAMQSYKKGQPTRTAADIGPKPSYSGTVVDAETHARDEERRTRTKAVSVINNAIAELVDLIGPLSEISQPHTLDDIVAGLRHNADMIAPARPV